MISIERVYGKLDQTAGFTSVVELAMILEANTSEVRQRLRELGERVAQNEHDEWRVVGQTVDRLSISPLSPSEIEEKERLENIVQQAFFVAGQALKTLRDKKLYRETHATFEKYAEAKFGYKKSAAYYLINASEVVNNLKCPQIVEKIETIEILPASESQCRPMTKLPPERQRLAWSKAIRKANGRVPSAKIVKEAVDEIEGKLKVKTDKTKRDGPVKVAGIGIEYVAHLDEETYDLLKEYQQRVGAITFNGAIRRLLNQEKIRTNH